VVIPDKNDWINLNRFEHNQSNHTQPLTAREGHRAVLSLLRAGALDQAEKEYLHLGLDKASGDEDILALGGRILKSKALEKDGQERAALALDAAEKYSAVYSETKGTYTGINTATLYLVGGAPEKAAKLAEEILAMLPDRYPDPGEDAYYHMATAAEARLIMGDVAAAQAMLADAIQLDPHNYEARASTLKQFEMLLDTLGRDAGWLDMYRPPMALHFAGHIFGMPGSKQELNATNIHAIEKTIVDAVLAENIGFAYGALAAGSDIVIAEQILACGAELHLVLPCQDEVFLEESVRPFGEEWVTRFYHCISHAKSVHYVSEDTDTADDLTLAFGSEIAMGHAVLKAQALATEAVQMLVWDGQIPSSGAGTARDAALWAKTGRRQLMVPYPFQREYNRQDMTPRVGPRRALKAMVFADVRGFGALPEAKVPVFLEKILQPLADCVSKQGHRLKQLNTWGDGLFLVLNRVEDAAQVAVALQNTFHEIDLSADGLPEFLALRVAGHYGPVYEMMDPFLVETGVFGTEVSFAARIEPVTVPGSIYVSEPFACALAANTSSGYRSEYVGEITPRKGVRALPLFSLRQK